MGEKEREEEGKIEGKREIEKREREEANLFLPQFLSKLAVITPRKVCCLYSFTDGQSMLQSSFAKNKDDNLGDAFLVVTRMTTSIMFPEERS